MMIWYHYQRQERAPAAVRVECNRDETVALQMLLQQCNGDPGDPTGTAAALPTRPCSRLLRTLLHVRCTGRLYAL